jgi:outer membrane protein OmpA-like peptidoglycan-associated protein
LLLGGKDPDADLDGIADAADRCVNQPEDRDGFEDSDGCPDPDNDGDGVADAADRCPREAETKNGFQDTDGCPDQAPEVAKAPPKPVDTDGDGLVDPADKCPNERETVNRYLDADGCADTIPAALQPYLDTPLAVEFSGGGSKFGGKSSKALEALLKALQGQPTVAIEVVGHTDETATPEANKQLSLQRAEAVKTWLVGKGIAADRVRTSGRGAEQPRPGTVRGDTKNRRIEILFP